MDTEQKCRELTAHVAALEFAVGELFRIVYRLAQVPDREIEGVESRMLAISKRWRPEHSISDETAEVPLRRLLRQSESYRDFYHDVAHGKDRPGI